MGWMRNTNTGTVVGPISDDSALYLELQERRDANGRPLWEDQGRQEVLTQLQSSLPNAGFSAVSQLQALAVIVPPIAAAAATVNIGLGRVGGKAGTVVKAAYIPDAPVVGQVTNFRTLAAINAGAEGAGSASIASLALTAGNNLAANVENLLTLGTTAVNPDDELEWQSALTGTGLADPGGVAVVTIALAA